MRALSPSPQRRREPRHVVAEDLFRCIQVRERKRADRSNLPFVLLTIDANGRRCGQSGLMWREVVQAVDDCTREIDLAGWLERRTALGVILHAMPAYEPAHRREIEVRLRRALVRHLDPDTVAKCSIRLDVLQPSPASSTDSVAPSEEPQAPLSGRTFTGSRLYGALKRLFDIAGSLALLTLLAPLLLVIAALVKLKSPGPVLFGQPRIGLAMKPFRMLKFRTMYVNADPALHQQYVSWFIKSSGDTPCPARSALFKLTDDPRVTTVGRVLRRTSLDELPQLWNVVRGEMSLVGPRPPVPYEVEQYKAWHTRRLTEAKPGITGLWQVGGRSRTTFDEMVRLDLRYARTCSFWTDLKILLATPAAVFSGKGAC